MKTKLHDVYKNKSGRELEVVEIVNSKKVRVKFILSGYEAWATSENIRAGLVKDRLAGTIFGVGSLGLFSGNKVKSTLSGQKWYNLLSRCYRESDSNYSQYGSRGVSVCEEWKLYANFAQWYDNYEYKEDTWVLDKDILQEDNLIYSPETCCLVPQEINNMFKRDRDNSKNAVFLDKKLDKPGCRKYCSDSIGVEKFGGRQYFHTYEEAMENSTQKKKEFIKYRAEKWKDKICPKVYAAMLKRAE